MNTETLIDNAEVARLSEYWYEKDMMEIITDNELSVEELIQSDFAFFLKKENGCLLSITKIHKSMGDNFILIDCPYKSNLQEEEKVLLVAYMPIG